MEDFITIKRSDLEVILRELTEASDGSEQNYYVQRRINNTIKKLKK